MPITVIVISLPFLKTKRVVNNPIAHPEIAMMPGVDISNYFFRSIRATSMTAKRKI